MKNIKRKLRYAIFFGFAALIISIPYLFPELLMPDELSADHSTLQCEDCHTPWIGARDSKCIACHETPNFHFHNTSEVQGDCQSCHQLHDYKNPKQDLNCTSCHTDVHPDENLGGIDCLNCHEGPNIINFDYNHKDREVEKISNKDDHEEKGIDCYSCHDLKKFNEYNCLSANCHGTEKYDKKHEEKAEDWKNRDCFESGCHSDEDERDLYNVRSSNINDIAQNDMTFTELELIIIILCSVIIMILGYIYIQRKVVL